MDMRSLFTRTLREAPSHAELASHRLLTRAGYFQEIGKGGFIVLPLGRRALDQLEKAFLSHLGIQSSRVEIPLIQSHEGAPVKTDAPRFNDSQGRQLGLISGYQASFNELACQHLRSYRHVPAFLHSSGPYWEKEVHPGSGLLYSRLPTAFDLCAYFANAEDLHEWQKNAAERIQSFLASLRIPFRQTYDAAPNGSAGSRAWYVPHSVGRSLLFSCEQCGYIASAETARFQRIEAQEALLPLEKVATPDCKTIDALANYLKIPNERTAKAIFLTAGPGREKRLIIAIVPGNRELDEERLSRTLEGQALHPAEEDEILSAGAVPGYGSPVGIDDASVVVDAQIPLSANLVAGANESGYHYLNVNYGRDYEANLIAEITKPQVDDLCLNCKTPMQAIPAVPAAELAETGIQHGVMDAEGKIVPLKAAALRLHATRLLAAIAETSHDDYGLILPLPAAPFPVHLVLLHDDEGVAEQQAHRLAVKLQDAGLEPLFDDRSERAGVKFNDADLIGIPFRITVSPRALAQDSVELKVRGGDKPKPIPLEGITTTLNELIKEMGA